VSSMAELHGTLRDQDLAQGTRTGSHEDNSGDRLREKGKFEAVEGKQGGGLFCRRHRAQTEGQESDPACRDSTNLGAEHVFALSVVGHGGQPTGSPPHSSSQNFACGHLLYDLTGEFDILHVLAVTAAAEGG